MGEAIMMMDDLVLEKIIKIRRELHQVPECSGQEDKTKSIIRAFLRDNTGLMVADRNDGIVAFYDSGKAGNTIAFRADFDAVSLPDGSAAHLCGHDGHTAALLGVAIMLEAMQPQRNVLLIFQYGEETGEGAAAMRDVLTEFAVAEIYGCHNLPGFPFGQVYTTPDTFACASCGMTFRIEGEPAHAAYPEQGVSPMGAVAALIHAVEDSQVSGRLPEGTFATMVGCNMGQKAFGTAAEKAEVWVTVRSRSQQDFQRIQEHLESVVKQACERNGASYQVELQDVFPATVNDVTCARKVLEYCGGKLLQQPMRWSEDFGHYLGSGATVGAFFGIGAGDCADLHTRDYQYPDELLAYQIQAFCKLL